MEGSGHLHRRLAPDWLDGRGLDLLLALTQDPGSVGYGFAVPTANRTGVLVVALSLLAAFGAFAYAYAIKGMHL